jgi:ribosomal protein S12 methylthiotransferase accessory factor
MGITRIADITGLDNIGIPVCMAVRPNSRSLSVSQGKGATLNLAKASAAMETIESYHAETINSPVINTTYQELRKNKWAIDPNRLPLINPNAYHHNLHLNWIEGFDLASEKEVWLPFDSVHTDYVAPQSNIVAVSSNGLASGNHLLEAISHGVCEVVERDATLHWDHHFTDSAAHVDLHTIESAVCQEIIHKITDAGLTINVVNITHEIGIPTFVCQIFDFATASHIHPAKYNGGYGTHLSKEVALLRAITEAVQSRLTFIAGSRDDMPKSEYSLSKMQSMQGIFLEKYKSGKEAPLQDYAQIPSLDTETINKDVEIQLELLRKSGFDEVIIVDLTKEEFCIPVVRVIIPDMALNHESLILPIKGQRIIDKQVSKIVKELEAFLG